MLLQMVSLRSKRVLASSSRKLGREKEWRGRGRGMKEWRNEGFLFSTPPPPSTFFFFCSRSNFRAVTRLETLATQASKRLWLIFQTFVKITQMLRPVFMSKGLSPPQKLHIDSVPTSLQARDPGGGGGGGYSLEFLVGVYRPDLTFHTRFSTSNSHISLSFLLNWNWNDKYVHTLL